MTITEFIDKLDGRRQLADARSTFRLGHYLVISTASAWRSPAGPTS
jgi:hypothetical protein